MKYSERHNYKTVRKFYEQEQGDLRFVPTHEGVRPRRSRARVLATTAVLSISLQTALPVAAMADNVSSKAETTSSQSYSKPVSSAQTITSSDKVSQALSSSDTSSNSSSSATTKAQSATSVSDSQETSSSSSQSSSSQTSQSSQKDQSDNKQDSSSSSSSSSQDNQNQNQNQNNQNQNQDNQDQSNSSSQASSSSEDQDTKNLDQNKKSILDQLSKVQYLSSDEVKGFTDAINNSKTNTDLKNIVNQINEAYTKDKQSHDLKVYQDNAVDQVSKLKGLSTSQFDYFRDAITKESNTTNIDNLVKQAQQSALLGQNSNDKQNAVQNQINKANKDVDTETHVSTATPNSDTTYGGSSADIYGSTWGTSGSYGSSSGSNSYYGGSASVSYTKNQTVEAFINQIAEQARDLGQKNDVFASVMIAQAILESGSGNSQLGSAPNYNLFGVKGDYKGSSVSFATQEDDGTGNYYTIQSNFRKYPSYKESLEDYTNLIKNGIAGNHDFYKPTWKSVANNYQNATKYLQGHYATDTTYAAQLNGLIKTYDLTQYDQEKPALETLADAQGQQKTILQQALKQVGIQYTFGGTTPNSGFDCSGLIQWVFSRVNISLPRTAQAQYDAATPVSRQNLKIGDLVFFKNTYVTSDFITHVGIYIGNNQFVQAGGNQVHVTSLDNSWVQEHLVGFGRVANLD